MLRIITMENDDEDTIWISPDGKIMKNIIIKGNWGLKPTENSECSIEITNYDAAQLGQYANLETFTIGASNSEFERLLDRCLITMLPRECSRFSSETSENQEVKFNVKLVKFTSNGQIFEWDAQQKYELAFDHKTQGIDLFNKTLYKDASYRFGKGLVLLCSIPVDVSEPTFEVDGMQVSELEHLKANLYNNLASCYLKKCDYESVLQLCKHVLACDASNVKALYKQGIAQYETADYEGSQESLKHILTLEPANKAVLEKLKFVNVKVAEGNLRMNAIFKRMFEKS